MSDNEKGFLQVNNQIVDYWMAHLTSAEFKTLLAIVRKTKGWNKPYDRISQSQIAELTGLTTRSVRTAISLLENKKLIIVAGDDRKTRLFSVNYNTVNNVETDVTAIEKAIKDAEVISKDAEVISHKEEVISKDAEVDFLHNKHYTKDTININTKDTININTKDISSEVKKPKAAKKKKHDIPDDFTATEKQVEKCNQYGINVQELIDGFDDFHSSKGNQYVDWSKAFNTWINNHIKFEKLKPINQGNNHANHQSANSQPNHFDQLRAEAAAKYGNTQPNTGELRTVN